MTTPAIDYTWDDNGNLVERASDTFEWDYEDRMVSATVNSVMSTYTYRGDGLRDSRTVGMTTTTFTWDINASLPVVLDDGNQYLYGAGLSAMKQSGNWYYYLADGLGSTMAVVDDSGVVQTSYQYDVYGEPTVTGSLANEFDFAGEQTDASTGLQYLRARYYDPATGVFLSRDVLEAEGGWGANPYAYASGRPTNEVDQSGMYPGEQIWGAVNSPEGRWCAARPWWWVRCARAGEALAIAFTAQYTFYGVTETDEADAFRHCVWSACLTLRVGDRSSKRLTDLHESKHPTDIQAHRMDMWNNEVGRSIGNRWRLLGEYAGTTMAIAECLLAAKTGRLIVNPTHAPPYPGEEKIVGTRKGSW